MLEITRFYVNPHPRYSAKAQVPDGLLAIAYVENRTGRVFDKLLRSLRKGDVVGVYRPFLLAPIRGRPATRRAKWLERVERIMARGAKLEALSHPGSSCSRLTMIASDEVAQSGRGAAGRPKSGRPPKTYTPEQRVIMEREWHSKKHKTRRGALRAIHGYGIKVTLGYMYTHFPVKDDA